MATAKKTGKKAGEKKVEKVMHEFKEGTLKSGKSDKKVKSRKQAVAIALSEAREAGAKIPKKKSTTGSKTKSTTKKSTVKKTSSAKKKHHSQKETWQA